MSSGTTVSRVLSANLMAHLPLTRGTLLSELKRASSAPRGETRQQRRQRERIVAKPLTSTRAAVKITGRKYHDFRELVAKVRDEAHLNEILSTVSDLKQREKIRRQAIPFLRFEVSVMPCDYVVEDITEEIVAMTREDAI